jgi:SAM-dependent methyltransferase
VQVYTSAMADDRPAPLPYSAAAERNRAPILAELHRHFADSRLVLEIGSGTGQHAVYFAAHLPQLRWQPTEHPCALDALRPRLEQEAPSNVAPALALDVTNAVWPLARVDAVYTANTLHIMSWLAVEATFRGIGRTLASRGLLAIYGPFRYGGSHTSESNAAFDRQLRARDPLSGVRDAEAVCARAHAQGLAPIADHALPANNHLLVFRRGESPAGT